MTDDGWAPHRAILHLDLDAFYASVEQLRRPELRGRPVIVGGAGAVDPGTGTQTAVLRRGVVSAASYEARAFGVRSAMPLARAVRLCPDAMVVPVDFPAYRAASAEVFSVVREYSPVVEPVSLDEAYLDLGGSIRRFGEPPDVARTLVQRIHAATHLWASVGVATSKTVAKIASDLRKPRGLVVVRPGDEAEFLAPLPLRALPGLGPATEQRLLALGVSTLGGLASLPEDVVRRRLGEAAAHSLTRRARGYDEAPVTIPGRPRSVSREETFPEDVSDHAALVGRVRELAADVGRRLRAGGWRARTVTLTLRSQDFTTISRQRTLEAATDADLALAASGLALLDLAWDRRPVRLLGVGVSSLSEGSQLDLLDGADERSRRVDRTIDEVRRRFGEGLLRRGGATPLRDLDSRHEDLRRIAGEPEVPRPPGILPA